MENLKAWFMDLTSVMTRELSSLVIIFVVSSLFYFFILYKNHKRKLETRNATEGYFWVYVVLIVFSYIYLSDKWTLNYSYEELMALPLLVLIFNLFYKLFINRCPVCFQKIRMIVIPLLGVICQPKFILRIQHPMQL